ncbi:MAG: helix-turn-helix domain-containing protein [Streptococcaceae bacterium]|nr:helix-turn-helix domain-containing protein [Streptococcaceae bacterium]
MNKKLDRRFPIKAHHNTSASDTLKETLEYYNISQRDFSRHIGVSQAYVSDILNRKKFMSSDVALAIEQATGINAGLLLRLDISYQLEHQRDNQTSKDIERYKWAIA